MTIPEAAQLVLQAGAMGKGGEIFLLDMGEPVKIVDLARDMITLSRLPPGRGHRDRVHRRAARREALRGTADRGRGHRSRPSHPKIRIWKNIPMDRARLRAGISDLLEIARRPDSVPLTAKIKDLVPEYAPPNHNASLSRRIKKPPERAAFSIQSFGLANRIRHIYSCPFPPGSS